MREATNDFISDRPERVAALREILATDEEHDDWTREDVPVDSEVIEGLVSRGILIRTDDGMAVVDRRVIRETINMGRMAETDDLSEPTTPTNPHGRIFVLLALIGALALVGYVRVAFIHDLVFRNGAVVLPANDPYRYRYWVEHLATRFPTVGVDSFTHLPGQLAVDDVLTVLTMWGIASIFGNDPNTIGTVLAWLPVVEALVTAVFIYLYTVRLSADFRAGIVTIVCLAITPIYATRTALGFADHHAFDSVWLALTALSIVMLAGDRTEATDAPPSRKAWSRWIATVGLGVGIAGQVLSWRGGPLFLAPIAFYVALKAVSGLSRNRSPFRENRHLLFGLFIGTVLTDLPHAVFGWLPRYRAFAPALLLGTTVLVFSLAAGVRRWGAVKTLGGTAVALAFTVFIAQIGLFSPVGRTLARPFRPGNVWSLFANPVELLAIYLQKTGQSGILETYSLIGGGTESLLRPVQAFGFVLFLAVPYMVWASWVVVREHRPRWLVATVYVWFFFVLSLVQIRFAGQLTLFVAPFAGVGFVHLATTGRRRRPFGFVSSSNGKRTMPSVRVPSRQTVFVVLLLFLLLVPIGLAVSFVHMRKLGVSDERYQTAEWINGYAANHGKTYPDNYVFSEWSKNRAYNYFVNGQSKEYGFAQKYYDAFINSKSPAAWVDKLDRLNRQGFVVLHRRDAELSNRTTYTRLYDHFGSRANGVPGLEQYRAVHMTDDGTTRVFEIVPGARLTTSGPPNTTVRVHTTVQIGGREIAYKRVGRTNRYGEYGVTVPYRGRYVLNGESRWVGGKAVRNGKLLGTYRAHYPFDAGHGTNITDPVGGAHGTVKGASWERGVRGTALSFRQGTDYAEMTGEPLDVGNDSFSVSVWVKGELGRSNDSTPHVLYGYNPNTTGGYLLYAREGRFCARLKDDHGRMVNNCGIDTTTFNDWTHIVCVFDRNANELLLYRNGTLVATRDARSIGRISDTRSVVISSPDARYSAPMAVDDVRLYGRALSQEENKRLQKRFTTN